MTTVDDVVSATIPGTPEQPFPDFVTHLKYKSDRVEGFVAGLLRDVHYRPDGSSGQNSFGWAANFVSILHPTQDDKLIGQVVFGDGLGRYRNGSDLRLATSDTVDTVQHVGGCLALTHRWSKQWTSTVAHSVAFRRKGAGDLPATPYFATYSAINLIWEPITHTTMGIEYLYGTNETKDGAFGFANRIQISVQYSFQ